MSEIKRKGTPMIEELLTSRNYTHGDFTNNARVSRALKFIITNHAGHEVSPTQREALDMICLKISRIITGDPNFKDHWDDIAGYATLAAKDCQ